MAPFAVGGEGDRRQTGRKVLQSLESAGWIRLHRVKGLRRQVSLTAAGDTIARSLCGLPIANEHFDLLCGAITDAYQHGHNRGYIHESKIPATTDQLLPLLVRGWLKSASDGAGRIGYGLTPIVDAEPDADRDHKIRVNFEIEETPELPRKRRPCAALYGDLLAAGLRDRELWEPEHPSSDIYIPLSCGMWPMSEPEAAT